MIEACVIGVAIGTLYLIASKYKKFTLSFLLATMTALGFFVMLVLLFRSLSGFFQGIL